MKNRPRNWTFLVMAVVVGLGITVSSARAAEHIACAGDSITWASGWTEKLAKLMGGKYTVGNYGNAGTTMLKRSSGSDNTYWESDRFTASLASAPSIVVIMLGTNDSKPQYWVHKDKFVADYEAMIDKYRALASRPRIYVNLPPPAGRNGYDISGTNIENEVIPLIRQAAKNKGVPTIDVFSAFGGHNLKANLFPDDDQVHPNAQGAQVIADTVYATLVAVRDGGASDAAADTRAALEAGTVDATTTDGRDAKVEGEASVDGATGPGDRSPDAPAGRIDAPATKPMVDAAAPRVEDVPSAVTRKRGCSFGGVASDTLPSTLGVAVSLVVVLGRRRR